MVKTSRRIGWLLWVVWLAGVSWGYPVGPAVPLEKMAGEADIIVKATVVSLKPAQNAWFQTIPAFTPTAAELKVISTLKGEGVPPTIRFLHYRAGSGGSMFMPQHYDLTAGRTYLFFADRTAEAGVYRQLWQNHTVKEDQGVVLASSSAPVEPGQPIKEVMWKELTGHLAAREPRDVVYGIRQLGQMSGVSPRWGTDLHDFETRAVEDRIAPLVKRPEPEVALEAIRTLGAASPWLEDGRLVFYLASLGGGNLPGLGEVDTKARNEGAARYWKELAARADAGGGAVVTAGEAESRAAAIRALGHCGVAEVSGRMGAWLEDSREEVREAATLLLADDSSSASARLLARATKDSAPAVRRGAAFAIGCGQYRGLMEVLEKMLRDEAPGVAAAAAESLLSFPLAESRAALARHADDAQFAAVFVNALAQENPKPWREQLARVIEKDLQPRDFWGGQIPSFTSWKILYNDLVKVDGAELKKSGYERFFNALENPKMFWSSSEPRCLYALYLDKGMTERAKAFRGHCEKTFSYDIGYYFKMADENPKMYLTAY